MMPSHLGVPGTYVEDRLIKPNRIPRQLWAEVDPALPRIRLNRQGKLAFVLVEHGQPFRAVTVRRGGGMSVVPASPSGCRIVTDIRFYRHEEGGPALGLWIPRSPKVLEVGDSYSLRYRIGQFVVRGDSP